MPAQRIKKWRCQSETCAAMNPVSRSRCSHCGAQAPQWLIDLIMDCSPPCSPEEEGASAPVEEE
jgi:hypothetical protein